MTAMFGVRRTFESVVKELELGLRDGSITHCERHDYDLPPVVERVQFKESMRASISAPPLSYHFRFGGDRAKLPSAG